MEGFLLRFREESFNEGTGWKVCVEGGGCARARVCLLGGAGKCVQRVECVRGGRAAYVEGLCGGFAVSHTCVSSSASFIWKCLR